MNELIKNKKEVIVWKITKEQLEKVKLYLEKEYPFFPDIIFKPVLDALALETTLSFWEVKLPDGSYFKKSNDENFAYVLNIIKIVEEEVGIDLTYERKQLVYYENIIQNFVKE